MTTPLVQIENLQALSLNKKSPLHKVINADISAGDVLFITGDNGTGKSTLLKTLLGLHPSYNGKFQIHCKKEEIQYLPQLGSLHFHIPLSLQDMVPEGAQSKILQNLDLTKKWNTASGGERQKVLMAAALSQKPKLLVLDEPFNHVDKDSAHLIESVLQDFLITHPESTLILVSHRSLVQQWPRVRFLEIK